MRILVFAAALAAASVTSLVQAPAASAQQVQLPSGTVVPVINRHLIDPEIMAAGSAIVMEVARDVSVNGRLVIARGAPVSAALSSAEAAGSLGEGGKILVTFVSTTGVDGTTVPLTGSMGAKGDDKVGETVALSLIVCPLFLLMEGDDATIAPGLEGRAITVGSTLINASNRIAPAATSTGKQARDDAGPLTVGGLVGRYQTRNDANDAFRSLLSKNQGLLATAKPLVWRNTSILTRKYHLFVIGGSNVETQALCGSLDSKGHECEVKDLPDEVMDAAAALNN